ncbi:MAG: 50S ribosomal protein L25 [Candidatus Moranbacteria bacterium GW2011_GWE2_35_2-]|nr:MAG: 50S ribosomal protein L25 [Candidatus Moranbacteria bacterium GW2011_GWE2_35_2-]KKQ22997.1 MAG: 50S ribosomal protein L25 [Candidatus Moranbacteria bacterium GW2011_GWF2_37_11]KKQ29355.1 MAG: 50S ribosomal protein L25 [Candidatus Moranbacteria bacterium GW2011_GWD1_37_17]KKQ30772.1 MAG: 50S ribosomal protein L25 [Candidatus Moranbacteria bacterium GW2011_GWE1_37_24]KKQ46850.1 MAG: 50S ribosomal protein L25 [Candidatus Moranbacteria bacterium GW2011_GWD2_37_9]HBO17032.1 50S ribosomal pr
MTNNISVKAQIREESGKKVKTLRKEGKVPAVVYGKKIKAQNLWVNALDFRRVYEKAGENTLIDLEIGEGKKMSVLIYDTQVDPLVGNFSHVDFFQVRMDEEIETEIPLEFVGEAPAVKNLGGILVTGIDEVPIRCLPGNMPSEFKINLSVLETFEDKIAVKDLPASDKVEFLVDAETIIASIAAPRSEEELADLNEKVEEDVSNVAGVEKKEVEGEKKEEKK